MFSRITGTIVEQREASVLVQTSCGLGYEVVLPPCVAENLRVAGSAEVSLEVHASLALEGNSGRFTYFGFGNAIEREFFEALISVASIGPRSAARAFSKPMAQIARAIDDGDLGFLRTLPGIGPQKARDIVAKLQGKVARFLLIRDAAAPRRQEPAPMPDFAAEALAVLLQLEYKRGEAEALIARTLEAAPHLRDAEALLAEIYRSRTHRKISA